MATMLGESDLVIGMDWLATYKAQINCETKSIKHQAPDGSIVTIYGDREKRPIKIISVMKAPKMIHHGCFAYLAYAIDTQKETKKVEEVSVVCEFPYVFPDELSGIPPDREVEFKIDLVPGAEPLAKAPYRLAPSEMKELMIQIQELLDKGFIRPSILTMGCASTVCEEERCQENAFQELKKRLTQAPVLTLPEGIEDLVIYSDASHQGLSCVLMQREIKVTQTEALKEENVKKERIFGQVKDLTENENGIKLSYYSSIGMLPYEMLYGRKCRTPICSGEIGQKDLGSIEVVKLTFEKLDQIRARLKAAQGRQKSYADKRRCPIEFDVGNLVMLKVSPWKGIIRFRKCGKLSPRYIGPFKIIERIGKVDYHLDLPQELQSIYNTFHVSYLRKCLTDESTYVPLNDIEVDNNSTT
ncbi:uncharacterized protein LOC143578410 [Bidens hawaiensis]|uniref:uncharacterized protein LOC143578410 n=1 Tax=Bidens hawaiensis TaxID=980011 RepID=UPI004049F260